MEMLLAQLQACADPSRLRLLAVCARGAFCVNELAQILGQSQPRLSRHLRVLMEAGLLECSREGVHAWFSRRPAGLADTVLAQLPSDDPLIAADRRTAARVLAERARTASAHFRRQGADWDEMRALDLPASEVEGALLRLLGTLRGRALEAGQAVLGELLDIGTGTGRLLQLCAPYARSCLGIDASPAMLALARSRISRPELSHCLVRQADAYRLPFGSARFDVVLTQMLLHHAEDPASLLAEARRVLRPDGLLVVIDLEEAEPVRSRGFRWPGFTEAAMAEILRAAGLIADGGAAIGGKMIVRLWAARPRGARADAAPTYEEIGA